MLAFDSMLIRVVRARRRCSGSASALTFAPLGTWRYRTPTAHRHVYDFYRKEPEAPRADVMRGCAGAS